MAGDRIWDGDGAGTGVARYVLFYSLKVEFVLVKGRGRETVCANGGTGSPNGAAFAYFLMQHKAQLGQKVITKVTVFRPENDDDVDFVDASLCFHVADGEQAAGEETGERIVRRNVVDDGTAMSLTRVHEIHA